MSAEKEGTAMTKTEPICGTPYEDGVHIHADARCWPLGDDRRHVFIDGFYGDDSACRALITTTEGLVPCHRAKWNSLHVARRSDV